MYIISGPWSDENGRKYPILFAHSGMTLSIAGDLLMSCVTTIPATYTMVGSCLEGFTGGSMFLIAACTGYISDVTSEKSRTFRIMLMGGSMALGRIVGVYGSGLLYDSYGYSVLFAVWECLLVAAFVYGLARFKKITSKDRKSDENMVNNIEDLSKSETQEYSSSYSGESKESSKKNKWRYFEIFWKAIKITIKKREKGRRKMIILLLIAQCIGLYLASGKGLGIAYL